MSQIVRIRRTQMVEREHLLQALTDSGQAWVEGGQVRGRSVDIKLKGQGIGFRKGKGSYSVISDRRVGSKRVAELTRQLTKRYIYLVTREKLEAQGFTLASEVEEEGKVHLVLRRMT